MVIQSRSASGSSGSLRGRAACGRASSRRRRARLRRRRSSGSRRALRAPEPSQARAPSVGDETLDLVLVLRRRIRRRAAPHAAASSASRSSPPGAETKIAAASERFRPLRARACRTDVDASGSRRGIARPKAERLRVEKGRLPVRALSRRRRSARVVARPATSSSIATSSRFGRAGNESGRRRRG